MLANETLTAITARARWQDSSGLGIGAKDGAVSNFISPLLVSLQVAFPSGILLL